MRERIFSAKGFASEYLPSSTLTSIRDFKKTDGVSGNFQQKFKVYGKNNTQCPRYVCGGCIQKVLVSGRAAFYCPKCQI